MAKLAARSRKRVPLRAARVVIDSRPIQEPERTPLTADYLQHLLLTFAAEPLEGESFVILSRTLRSDPADELVRAGLPVVARRRLPPTSRVFRSAGLTLDSFLLRGAEVGSAVGAAGTVFHTAGGAVPLASRLPVVATLLDMAPWELPQTYAASPAARFGHRLRARVLRDAARVIVCSRATADSARRRLHLPRERLAVVPLAVDEAFVAAGHDTDFVAQIRQRLSLPPRYMAFAGRYDARKDMRTLFQALDIVRRRASAADGKATRPALVVVLPGDDGGERELVNEAVAASGVTGMVSVVIASDARQRAAIVAAAEAFAYPCLSEATALPALEALAVGIPVIGSRTGALPESVGSAGIVVEPRDPNRLAAAIEALWSGGSLAEQLRTQARKRAAAPARTWSDVARETREVYAAALESDPTAPASE